MLADRGVKLEEALDLHQDRHVTLEPTNGAYLDSLGWAYFSWASTIRRKKS